jgi:nucleotide-binding universal stress UspA family protein
MAETEHFLHKVFEPKASANGAEVISHVINARSDSSGVIGGAICNYVEKHKPAALIMMRQNKSAMTTFFVGSVTKHCAVHCPAPVIVVPQGKP